jgi:hypothetical protein
MGIQQLNLGTMSSYVEDSVESISMKGTIKELKGPYHEIYRFLKSNMTLPWSSD